MRPKVINARIAKQQAAAERRLQKIAKFKRRSPRLEIEDYTLASWRGPVKLSKLFGKKKDLILIHNMGAGCSYCTLWADGFNGIYPHLANRAGFAVISPDSPAAQKKFARSRKWRFPMVSGQGTMLGKDLGFDQKDLWWPGVSTFERKNGRIYHVASAVFGPFDPFCSAWHLFALLAGGVDDWSPKYRY